MIKEVRDFLIPFGGTLGDLIDATPRDNISRVFLEDKLFETWHYGRTVLVGDGLCTLLSFVDCVLITNDKLCSQTLTCVPAFMLTLYHRFSISRLILFFVRSLRRSLP